jgi:hypothetical protein
MLTDRLTCADCTDFADFIVVSMVRARGAKSWIVFARCVRFLMRDKLCYLCANRMAAAPDSSPDAFGPKLQLSTLRWTLFLLVVAVFLAAIVLYAGTHGCGLCALIGLWPLCSLLVVTTLYALASVSSPLGVRLMDGSLWPAIAPLLWPFQTVAWALTHAKRALMPSSALPSRVLPHLWLGMRPSRTELALLDREGVYHIVDLCAEIPANPRVLSAPFERLHLPVLDRCPPTIEQLTRGAAWINTLIDQGQGVYVHCAFGRGRSAMLCAAVVITRGLAHNARDAMTFVRASRPEANLKSDQWTVLEHFALLHAKLSVRDPLS